MNLNDRALLVQLSISQWTARKYDKKATRQVADANGTTMDAGRYNKALLPMNDLLDHVHKKSTLIRQKYYDSTLPWGIDGTQMLPTSNYLQFMSDFRKEKGEWESLVQSFIDNYDQLKKDAQRILGNLYDPADYPSAFDIQRKFSMDMAVYPVPSSDFRVAIGSDELTRIQQDVERRVKDAEQTAMKELWQRLYDRVKHMAEKLADPKAIFRDSMIENAREICTMLPRLNFNDDPDLEAMRQQVEATLLKHPDALRNDPDLRHDTAADAKAIMDKMSVFMGGL
jgi:uncharacterized small protein (DUF1192 family)